MDDKTFLFRRFLYQISNNLSSADVHRLQFMLDDDLPRPQLEAARTGFDIFCLMEERGLLSPDNLDYLRAILDTVSKAHYIDKYLNVRGSAGNTLRPVPGVARGHTKDSHKRLLVKLGDGMTPENVRDIALFCHGGASNIHVKDLDILTTAEMIFMKLGGSRTIQPGDYKMLYNILDVLGRQDLCEKIEEHCRNPGSEAVTPQRDTGGTLPPPVPVQDNSLPSTYAPSSGSYSSNQTTMESNSGFAASQLVYQGPAGRRPVFPGAVPDRSISDQDGAPVPIPEDHRIGADVPIPPGPKLEQLEHEKQGIQEQLAEANRQAQNEKVRELEELLRQKNLEVAELQQQIQMLPKVVRPPSYEMNHTPHGVAIVIVNERFDKNPLNADKELQFRNGAQKDLKLLQSTFGALKYNVQTYKDLTGEEMLQVMNEVAHGDHSNHDSFVCCVSTHGDSKGLYGSDSVLISFAEIQTPIKLSEQLKGKPKLFFYQSCRSRHMPVTADSPGSGQEDKDIYTVYASTPFKDAFISTDYGSWLVSAMYRSFTAAQLMYTENLDTLMNYVCAEVGKQIGLLKEDNKEIEVTQCVQRENTLTKKVYFFPQ